MIEKPLSDICSIKEVPEYYLEGECLESKFNSYKRLKGNVLKFLQFLNHLISDIEGKLKEVDTALDGDFCLEVTRIRIPRCMIFFRDDEMEIDKVLEAIRVYAEGYNRDVKNEAFALAKETLLELQKELIELRKKMAHMFGIWDEEIEKKAHRPIVIRERKRKSHE